MELPNFCSVYKPGKVYFGGYPSQEWFNKLREFGITLFVDLTTKYEKHILPYTYSFNSTIHFPIRDNSIPYNAEIYSKFIINLSNRILSGKEKIYVHCKGGHGRSGMVIASLMCYIDNLHPVQAIEKTTVLHSNRKNLKSKYKNIKCPDNNNQIQYVMELFNPIFITDYHKKITNLFEFIYDTKTRPIISTSVEMETILKYLRYNLHNKPRKYTTNVYCQRLFDKYPSAIRTKIL